MIIHHCPFFESPSTLIYLTLLYHETCKVFITNNTFRATAVELGTRGPAAANGAAAASGPATATGPAAARAQAVTKDRGH